MALNLQYDVTELDSRFLKGAISEVENRFRKLESICKKFDQEAALKIAAASLHNPITDEEKKYKYPLAKHIETLFHFISTPGHVMDVEESLAEIEEVFIRHPFFDGLNYKLDNSRFRNTKVGFLYYISNLKLDLLAGANFSAQEMGFMCGVTGQAITNRIKRENNWLTAEKVGAQFVIDNESAKKLVRESDSPMLGPSPHTRSRDISISKKQTVSK